MSSEKLLFYHNSEIEEEIKKDFKKIRIKDRNLNDLEIKEKWDKFQSWLRETPKFTTIRVNTLVDTPENVILHLETSILDLPRVKRYSQLPEMLVIPGKSNAEPLENLGNHEAIVDAPCGAAVLRGAHVFAPGIMGLTGGARIGDRVSVYADVEGRCRKGLLKKYESPRKIYLGTGILEQNRGEIFLDGSKGSGLAIRMVKTTSGLPQVSDECLKPRSGLLQNLPSIVCSRILDPQPGEVVLDLCAAPGNKTTHLMALMEDRGTLVALEKVQSKIARLHTCCDTFGCTNVAVFRFDSTQAVASDDSGPKNVREGPPFRPETFDKILLDGPCSALGKRPLLLNKIKASELRSFVSLQRKLFRTAEALLKPGGVLVYSTCTITVAENEGIVSWALKTFPSLQIAPAREKYLSFGLHGLDAAPGLLVDDLKPSQADNLLRFGPESNSIGFFIAQFLKSGICG